MLTYGQEKSTWLNWIFQSSIEFRRRLKDSEMIAKCRYDFSKEFFRLTNNEPVLGRFFSPNTLLIKIFVHADLHMQNNRAWFCLVSARSCVSWRKGKEKRRKKHIKDLFFSACNILSLFSWCFYASLNFIFVRISRFFLPFSEEIIFWMKKFYFNLNWTWATIFHYRRRLWRGIFLPLIFTIQTKWPVFSTIVPNPFKHVFLRHKPFVWRFQKKISAPYRSLAFHNHIKFQF